MASHEVVRQHCPDPAYANETWRAKHHFKELHQHNPPARRNKDFKATPYGAMVGITNFRHATPFLLLKHLGDFRHEEKHHPTKWAKRFIAGAMFGLVVGQLWFFWSPINGFAAQKLFASVGERPFSGIQWRLFKQIAVPHMLYGGSAMLGYELVKDFMTHHNHTSNRPKIVDHLIAYTIIGGFAGALTGSGGPMRMWQGAFFFGSTLGPVTWWLMMQGFMPGQHRRPHNIFYEDSCSTEEVARIRHLDEIENLAYNMQNQPGYGYQRGDMRWDN